MTQLPKELNNLCQPPRSSSTITEPNLIQGSTEKTKIIIVPKSILSTGR